MTARPEPGPRLIDGQNVLDLFNMNGFSAKPSLVATAGGAQASSLQLTSGLNEVVTVASSNDSSQLPAAKAGSVVFLRNEGANTMRVYGREGTSDTINGTIGTTAVTLASTACLMFFCPRDGVWYSGILS